MTEEPVASTATQAQSTEAPQATAVELDTNTPESPTATSQPPTATSEPPTATLEPTATKVTEEVTLKFVKELGTIEELDPIISLIEVRDGIISASGSEQQIKITYDPDVLTLEDVIALMKEVGKPVQEP